MNVSIRVAALFVLGLAVTACGGTYRPGGIEEMVARARTPPVRRPVAERGRWETGDGVELYYETRGAGRNVLVVHGGPGYPPAQTWPAADALGGQYRFVYYHQRGSGRSHRPIDRFESQRWGENRERLTAALGIEAHLADIETVRRILGDERLVIVGHSYGAFLAALYAAEFPDRVERLVLIAPARVLTMPPEHGDLFSAIEARLPEERRAAYRRWLDRFFDYRTIWSRSEHDLAEINAGLVPFFSEALESYLAENDPDGAVWGSVDSTDLDLVGGWIQPAIYLSLGRRYDVRPFLGRITAETRIFVGDMDFVGTADRIDDYAAAIPGAEVTVLGDAGHFPQGDAARFTEYLRDALGGTL
ncbi:MAG: alpha/beta hydrolase [Spirochaetales bacterium]|nr:alpha/beta hydrolase [Spirochaetales bacterium]